MFSTLCRDTDLRPRALAARKRLARAVGSSLFCCVAVACGPEASPTTPTTSQTPPPGAQSEAQLTVVVDSLRSEEAIAGLSEVSFDASGSTGAGPLTYRFDFGDGSTWTTATARHVYAEPGTYTVTATVTDSTGRAMSASKRLVVRSVTGAWLHTGYSTGSRAVMVRRLSVTSQSGMTVRGFIGLPNQPDRPVSGELVPPRTLRFTFDDPAFGSLEGVLPGVLEATSPIELRASGGPANGELLAFRATEGDPTGPPPDAVLNHRYFSFGAPYAIEGFSPMRFDASGSRGEGLSYFIEFGDGQVSTEPIAVHPIEHAGGYQSRLTVVDRFGRADEELLYLWVNSLQNYVGRYNDGTVSYVTSWRSYDGGYCDVFLDRQRGADLAGTIDCGELQGRVSGSLSGQEDVRLVVDGSGVVLAGTLRFAGPFYNNYGWYVPLNLVLVQTGGTQSGLSRRFRYYCDSACSS